MLENRDLILNAVGSFEDGAYIVDRQHVIEYINPVIEREFGKINDRKCHEYFNGRAKPCPWCRNKEVFAGKAVKWEWHSPKNGRHYDIFSFPIRNAGGGVSKFEILHDITGRKKILDALLEDKKRFRSALKTGKAGTWLWDCSSGETAWGDNIQELFGFTPGTFPNTFQAWRERIHPDDRAGAFQVLLQAMKSGQLYEDEYRIRGKGDVWLYVRAIATVVRDGKGNPLHMIGLCQDVTEQKRAETERERKYRDPDGLIVIEATDGHIKKVNPAFAGRFGYGEMELPGRPFSEFIHPGDRGATTEEMEGLLPGKTTIGFENRFLCKDGSYKWLSWKWRREENLIHATARDITEQKRREEHSSFEMREIREIVESNTDIFYVFNPENRLMKWNKALEGFTGLSPQELMLRPALDFVCAEDRPLVYERIREVFEKGYCDVEARFIRGDGAFITYLCNGYLLRDADGTVTGFAGIGRDISQRVKAELAIRESEEHYRGLFENASDYIYTSGPDGLLTSVNRALCKRCGYRAKELIGAPIGKIIPPASLEKAHKITEASLNVQSHHTRHEAEIIAKNGEIIPVELDTRLVFVEGKPVGVQGIARDIGERKASEKKLRAAKEEAEAASLLKSKFVSLVSHDLRAPLASIGGLLETAMSKPENPQSMTMVRMAAGICETMMEMTDNLLESARLQTGDVRLNRKVCNVRNICGAVMEDIGHLAALKGVVLKNEIPDYARLYVDRALFKRVIHNLVMNAIKFSNKGSAVTLFMPEGNVLAVKDAGVGIGEAVLPNLFSYEVKTSTAGTAGEKGTGFGLPISMDIVKVHGGDIRVVSKKGEGTVFSVVVPDVKPVVLVVEDDEVSVFSLRIVLDKMGAEVLAAKDGAEALEIIQGGQPALIITDYMMPVMDGFTLLQALKSQPKYSHIPVVLITASHAGDIDIRKKAFEYGADDFITKPLSEADFIPRIGRFIAS